MPGREPALLGRHRECATLDRVLAEARSEQSRVLVLRGEAGIGKTALLEYARARARGFRVARAAGVESEQVMAYAGLHQLCAPFLDRLDRLPGPQRDALGTAFGLSSGARPTRFLVGLAVLTLLADVAEEQPLLCLVDDVQWLDRMSEVVLAFVARRLLAERIVVVFALRETGREPDLAGLPELPIGGLGEAESAALLASVVKGPVDGRVRDRIIAEAHGNPLALLELPRAWTAAEPVDGFGRPGAVPLAGRIEHCFVKQLEPLPADTRRLLLIAAAEPLGDATLLWGAAGRLGLGADPAAAAEATGLIEFGRRIRFRHPLVRSAVYRSAPARDRQDVHRALADVTDPGRDPDRRAWHRAQATVSPDEDVAADLERSAGRARARGGLVAAAAFLEQAALLTPEPARRAERELAAAAVKRDAGALGEALGLLDAAEAGPPDAVRAAEAGRLRGQIAFDQRRGGDAARLLLRAAERLTPLDASRARETYLAALAAALWAGADRNALVAAAEAARAAPPAPVPPRAVDLVLDALATRLTDGHQAAAPLLATALAAVRGLDAGPENTGQVLWLLGNRAGGLIATEAADFAAARALAERQVQLARDAGALVQLQFALNFLGVNELLAGELTAAAASAGEDRAIAEATGNAPVGYAAMLLEAFRGREERAAELFEDTARQAAERGQLRLVTLADYGRAVLYNGLGRHDAALDAASRVFDHDVVGFQSLATTELAEAASRTGDEGRLRAAAARSAERAAGAGTAEARGLDARVRALSSTGPDAEDGYRESIARLEPTPLRVDLARGHLLYGEWLRREGRRVDARAHLHTAHEQLSAMGLTAFAERARRELQATGETARKRTAEPTGELTAQEFQIARLAAGGYSNPEIGTRLFLSPRTVEWHLRKIFAKLGISSRRQLRDVALAGA
ncbi:ATP-binding protein [Amycolatopsis rifamycinica]|uniref:LuxR family transcriptional regulator n=1 Tax=Amycolatopsis rifamycinica TaxID=287986 RepID=A0A066U261_9PSEU|nr:LuxR family transcriptional regulator [Amycolatopsis rifamycinica]KDN21551.1 LuxR family transcriptional regulator [Amycolatopsis rifamycinica]